MRCENWGACKISHPDPVRQSIAATDHRVSLINVYFAVIPMPAPPIKYSLWIPAFTKAAIVAGQRAMQIAFFFL